MKFGIFIAAILSLILLSSPASAKRYHHKHYSKHYYSHHVTHRRYNHRRSRIRYADGRPHAWCGWYMARHKGIGGSKGRSLWLAANWAHVGTRTEPSPGAIVVWAHHVGELVRHVAGSIWIVHSGNDGHAVRTRPRSIAGAIAFRRV